LLTESGSRITGDLYDRYYKLNCNKENLYPLAIYPPHLDERMAAQQACFTLFGNIVDGLNHDNKNYYTESIRIVYKGKYIAKPKMNYEFIKFVTIDAKSKKRIFEELRTLGITTYSIFPDLDGLGKMIRYNHEQDVNLAYGINRWMNKYLEEKGNA
jgi:hypothetical protein